MSMMKCRKTVAGGLLGLVLCAGAKARASEQELMEKIKALENRITQLEGTSLNASNAPAQTLAFLGKTTISGFASSSFFHNFNNSQPVAGYVTKNDQFAINKLKLALEKPVDYNKDKWDVGYRADVIVGEDAKLIHGRGLGNSAPEAVDLEQAYINMNLPIGNGLKLAVGKMVTLMGVEVIEETANPNWTVGNQFVWVENFTQVGALLSYKFTDKVEAQLAIFNGWDRVNVQTAANNGSSMSYMGKFNITVSDKTSVSLLAYGGPEVDTNSSNWRKGAEVIVTQKVGSKLTLYAQGDYGQEDNVPIAATVVGNAEWYAAGIWGVYQFSDKVGASVRADYLVDKGATRLAALGVTPGDSPNLASLTFTLNLSPFQNLQVRPEVRWDHCSKDVYSSKGDLKNDQFLAGVGVAYTF